MSPPLLAPPPPRPVPIGPTVDAWRAMSAAARERFLVEVLDALTEPAEAMTEGRPHKHAKAHALDLLGLHFRTLGRSVYVQEEMAIVYPGEPVFSPDIIAVLDVAQPAVDERLAWVVADEGKGIDFVLEVLHQGDRQKDLVHNVQRYARLSIPEYFVYDRALQRVVGHRLGAGSRYERIVPQGGRAPSAVLGLDLAIEKGSLRFFHGAAELYDSTSLIERLSGLVGDLQARADEAAARANEEATRANEEATRAGEETTRAREAVARAEAAEARESATTARANQAVSALRAGIVQLLQTRGVAMSDGALQRLNDCDDALVLGRWLGRALIMDDADSALGDD